ncbi:alpha 1,2-mannosyltransferase 2.4.1 [Mortierella alpina]|nr:alpha 1,2-mannosyltransferase 2.4.1 [Mortierella alpina]
MHAPSRYVRFVRVFVPLAAFCGLVYLFLVTFLPDHFAPVTTRASQDARLRRRPVVVMTVQDDGQVLIDDSVVEESRHNTIDETAAERSMHTESQFPSSPSQDEGGVGSILRKADRGDNDGNDNDNDDRLKQMKEWQDGRFTLENHLQHPPEPVGKGMDGSRMEQEAMSAETESFQGEDKLSEAKRAKGVLVIVTREEEIQATRETIRQMEDRFNRDRHYPWVVLSPHPLTEGSMARMRNLCKGAVMTFGTIPREQWRLPKWIEASKVLQGDYEKMKLGLDKTALDERHKWRYMSGFLARHELLDGYEFFWRVEPGMEIFCDIADDPMLAMKKNGHLFAWSLSETVRDAGVPGAWSLIKRFKETHSDIVPKTNDEAFLTREDENAYTGCTYGVQNSIARVDFLRSPEYLTYFSFMDRHGPIYYEKWSDATVMTIGLSLLASRNDTVHMKPNGWSYGGQSYCPSSFEFNRLCHCDPTPPGSALHMSCTDFWAGVGPSPRRKERVECNKEGKCVVYVSKAT